LGRGHGRGAVMVMAPDKSKNKKHDEGKISGKSTDVVELEYWNGREKREKRKGLVERIGECFPT
jgi:hypothetical protein